MSSVRRPLRVALIADFREEQWPSMDLIAETIVDRLGASHRDQIDPTLVRPPMPHRFARFAPRSQRLHNADRLMGRLIDYPLAIRRIRSDFDILHIVDHSYAHLVHYLPADRTIVTCHDLDTFRCLLTPESERRSELFRAMTRRILSGLQSAAAVACVSNAIRDQLLRLALLPADRVAVVHNGVSAAFTPTADARADAEISRMLGPVDPQAIELLHVGSAAPRKRLDLLLRVFAGARNYWPAARLIRVGGGFTHDQEVLAGSLGLHDAIAIMPRLDKQVLSAIYRRATLLLITSESEGFGLPMVEALACGTPVLASRIAPLLEVGGAAAEYAPVGDIDAWVTKVNQLLGERAAEDTRWAARAAAGRSRANEFSWDAAVAKLVDIYRAVIAGTGIR